MSTPTVSRLPFTPRQLTMLVVLGTIFWFAGAMLLRLLEPLGALQGSTRILTYAAILVGTLPLIPIVRAVAGVAPHDLALAVSICTGAAVTCDGIALAWVPTLYGNALAHHALSGPAILWGAGAAIFLGCLFNKSR